MAKQSIESMYELMFSMRDHMEDLLQDAQELAAASKTYGGEIARILTEQLSKYFAPTIKKLIDDEETPGAIIGLIRFMDSLPLAYTRVEPSMEDIAPEAPEEVQLNMPAEDVGPVAVEDLPQNTSFAQPANTGTNNATLGEAQPQSITESIEEPEVTEYRVVRRSNIGSSLGEDIANLEDTVVGSFDTEEEAIARAELLNNSLEPFEKDAFGFEYDVVEATKTFANSEESSEIAD